MVREAPRVGAFLDWAKSQYPRVKAIKVHGNAYMETGTPDVFGSIEGSAFLIEFKQDGKDPEPIQLARLVQWRKTRAITGVAYSKEDALWILGEGATCSERCYYWDNTIEDYATGRTVLAGIQSAREREADRTGGVVGGHLLRPAPEEVPPGFTPAAPTTK